MVGFGLFLVGTTVVLAIVDWRHLILPDHLNALLAAGGISQVAVLGRPGLIDAGLGGLLGFLILYFLAASFRHVRGVEGLGFGDQKFAAAAGLWIGWQQIALMLLIASLSALAFVAIVALRSGSFSKSIRLPFGPFLGVGVTACWLNAVAFSS